MSQLITPQTWVIGNWKLNPPFPQAQQLFTQLCEQYQPHPACQIAIAPPMPYLAHFARQQQMTLVAQDLSVQAGTGAYTGEVSAELLGSIGVQWVLIGHSERRELFGDNTERLQQKIRNARQADLNIIFCVGETLAQREANQAQQVVLQQLDALKAVSHDDDWQHIIIAYEPVWAIGTGKNASSEDAQQMHAAIRHYLRQNSPCADQIPLLYGGSVKPENALQLAACADINGALVGGASLDAQSFLAIIQAFTNV